jgi:hypothetical protein
MAKAGVGANFNINDISYATNFFVKISISSVEFLKAINLRDEANETSINENRYKVKSCLSILFVYV